MRLLGSGSAAKCLSGTDSLEALRRRCGEDAPKAAAYLMKLRKLAQ